MIPLASGLALLVEQHLPGRGSPSISVHAKGKE